MEGNGTSFNNSSSILKPCTYSLPFSHLLWRGYFASFSCLLGIFGNLICMLVLSRRTMRTLSVNRILLTMSASDFTYTLCAVLIYSVDAFSVYYCIFTDYVFWFSPLVTPALYTITTTAQLTSNYLTVLVSFERYVAVCHPFLAKSLCSPKQTTWWCAGVLLGSILFVLPSWWEIEVVPMVLQSPEGILMEGYYMAKYSALFEDPVYYKYYVKWGTFIVFRLFPFVVLVILNSIICKTIIEMSRMRHTMTRSETHEVSITRVLLAVVLLFLLCNIVKICEVLSNSTRTNSFFSNLSDFLVIANAGFNFVIYCVLCSAFRAATRDLFRSCVCKRGPLLERPRQPFSAISTAKHSA